TPVRLAKFTRVVAAVGTRSMLVSRQTRMSTREAEGSRRLYRQDDVPVMWNCVKAAIRKEPAPPPSDMSVSMWSMQEEDGATGDKKSGAEAKASCQDCDANNPALASIPTTGSSNQFLYNDDRQHEFEPETRPYYGSLGRSPQPHQPHHRQQRQSRIGDKMRHSLDSEQRQQRQQQQRNSRRPANHGRQAERSIVYGSHQQPPAAWRNGRSASYTSNGGTSDSDEDDRTNDLLLYGADGKAAATAAPARRPAATATSGRQQRPSSATQHQRSRQRDTSGQRGDGRRPFKQQPFATAGRLPFAPKQGADIRSGGPTRQIHSLRRFGSRRGLVHFVGAAACLAGQIIMSALSWTRRRASTTGCTMAGAIFSANWRRCIVAFKKKLIMCYQAA
uniref:Btz domain-containing protein n=1 Tax=Macrostomum lignano TaxID=282301 RepID=A0A1I8FB40_9PLAT